MLKSPGWGINCGLFFTLSTAGARLSSPFWQGWRRQIQEGLVDGGAQILLLLPPTEDLTGFAARCRQTGSLALALMTL
jgi:hypothetical protein